MKAVRIHDYGDVNQLRYEDAPVPEMRPDEVLLRVHAAGVNPVDWKSRSGLMRQSRPLRFPSILGSDAAGTVERVGAVVTRFQPGDAVVARVSGAYAEFAAAKTDAVGRAPKSIPLAHVAGIPVAAGTAWTVLFEAADLKKAKTILIQGGAGGVGTFAIQLAKLAGLNVVATTSAANSALVRSLGADEVINYQTDDVAKKGRDFDLVFDTVGGDVLDRSFELVKKGGQLLSIAALPSETKAQEHGIEARFVQSNVTGIKLEEIGGLIDAGKVRIVIGKEFRLTEAKAAHELSETGHAHGKIILRVI